jgi:hypothetical protein
MEDGVALDRTLQDGVLDWLKGTPFSSPPTALYLSLHYDTEASSAADVSSSLGGRVAIDQAFLSSTRYLDGQSAGTRQVVNTRAFITELATATVTVASFGIWDASSGGNRLLYGLVEPEVTVLEGDPAIFLQGDLSLRMS